MSKLRKGFAGFLAKRRETPATTNVQISSFDPQNGTTLTTHSLVGVPAGALLVLTTQDEFHSSNCVVSSVPSLAWTKRLDSSAVNSGNAEIYTATFPAGGNIVVTSDWSGGQQSSVCYVMINAESIPAGANATAVSQSLPSVAVGTTRLNSILVGVTSDYNAADGTSRAYRSSATETKYFFAPTGTTGYHYYKTVPTLTNTTMGLTAPNMVSSAGTCVLEIRSVPPGGPDIEAPSAPVLQAGSITSSSIAILWTNSTDNIGVVGYDVYVNSAFVATSLTNSYTVTGLAAATQYNIFVRARDAANNSTSSNTVSPTTLTSGGGGTPCNWSTAGYNLTFQTGYDQQSDLLCCQLGLGRLSTTVFHTGPASFYSIPEDVSNGIRSEVQYGSAAQNNDEGVVEYWVRYEVAVPNNGHSFQWHPNTGGGSGSPRLEHIDGEFAMTNWIGGANTDRLSGITIQEDHWYNMRMEYKFGTASGVNQGYFRLYIDCALAVSWNGQVGDGSGQYMKVGWNGWLSGAAASRIYYDDLKIWAKI